MTILRSVPLALTLLAASSAGAQPGGEPAPAAPETAGGTSARAGEVEETEGESRAPARVFTDPARRTGFTTGLRLGVGVPFGEAGQDAAGVTRDLGDLTSWRAPLWLDVGYTPAAGLTLGIYGQLGVGGVGDACVVDCDWTDLRLGAQAELRFLPGALVDPWLGVGLGYEWLSYRQLLTTQVTDATGATRDATVRATERFAGPELLLQGGVDFQVENALRIGPYAAATLGQYLTDSFECQPESDVCPSGSSVDGAAFHAWISVGLRGAYTP